MIHVPPLGDLALQSWSENFDVRITAAPTPIGLTAAQATAYHGYHTSFVTELTAALDPDSRTKAQISAKNLAKRALRDNASQLIKIISATPGVTDEQRILLGLHPRDVSPTPVPRPITRPQIRITPDGVIYLADETTPTKKGRPAGVKGAVVLTKLAPATQPPPATLEEMMFAALATRATLPLPLPEDADTKKLYVVARWFNERGQLGPASEIVSTTIAA